VPQVVPFDARRLAGLAADARRRVDVLRDGRGDALAGLAAPRRRTAGGKIVIDEQAPRNCGFGHRERVETRVILHDKWTAEAERGLRRESISDGTRTVV